MNLQANEPEATNALFEKSTEHVPPTLRRATLRMEFPPSYVLVGVYRLFTDKTLYKPAWDKCKHGTRRGAIVGAIWASVAMRIDTTHTYLTLVRIGLFYIRYPEEIHRGVSLQVFSPIQLHQTMSSTET